VLIREYGGAPEDWTQRTQRAARDISPLTRKQGGWVVGSRPSMIDGCVPGTLQWNGVAERGNAPATTRQARGRAAPPFVDHSKLIRRAASTARGPGHRRRFEGEHDIAGGSGGWGGCHHRAGSGGVATALAAVLAGERMWLGRSLTDPVPHGRGDFAGDRAGGGVLVGLIGPGYGAVAGYAGGRDGCGDDGIVDTAWAP